ncbi:MAG: hypothetical protein IJT36_06810 [Alphaproteobacteria bacterium]|nr:hypothetical protein [Alphaproteobacteria bacterium]
MKLTNVISYRILKNDLTDKISDREMFMKGIIIRILMKNPEMHLFRVFGKIS